MSDRQTKGMTGEICFFYSYLNRFFLFLRNVGIRDFSSSWQSGLCFNALIHSHMPDLINFNKLDKDDRIGNLRNAFDIAEKHLGIPKLLDAEDVDVSKPDEKSVITYVASYYHTFSKMKAGATGGKRIGNIVLKIKNIEDQQVSFESYSTNLVLWIKEKTSQMQKRVSSNTLEGIQVDFEKFKDYRAVEYLAEVALKEELLRQEKLEQLAYKFDRKSVLREGYLNEMIAVLSDPRYGSSPTCSQQVGASVKKHEAISADILARQERFRDLKDMSSQLQQERFWREQEIRDREKAIM